MCPGIGVGWEDVDGKVGVTLELCAGIVDKDLSLEDTAVAEVLEEKKQYRQKSSFTFQFLNYLY